MRSKRFPKLGAVVASMLVAGVVAAPASHASHQTVAGLTTEVPSKLVFFTPGHPETVLEQDIDFNGNNVNLVGIDYRPRANLLYGYSDTGILYVLRPDPDVATEYDANPLPFINGPFMGSAWGFDFNPVADNARLVADTGHNYRIDADRGERYQESNVAYPPGATVSPSIAAIAYSNSYPNLGSTTLYGIDAANDALVTQATDGTLTPVGTLGSDTTDIAGLDILTSFGTPAPLNVAYASLTPPASTESFFHTVNLQTGAATPTSAQAIGGGSTIESVSLPLAASVKFANGASQAGEGNVFVQVTVERHGRNDRLPSTVDYSTSIAPGDTAEQADFTPASGRLTFPPGSNSQSFNVAITDDALSEGLETFQVNLGASSSSMLVSPDNSVAKVLIVDNDGTTPSRLRPLLSIPAQSFRQVMKRVRAAFSCNRSCNANLSLFAGKRKVSKAGSSLSGAGTRKVRFAIDNADRRLFRNRLTARGLKLTVKGVFRIPGRAAPVRRTLTFRAHL